MESYYWKNMSTDWLWIMGFIVILLLISSAGNWGYTYHVHRKFRHLSPYLRDLDALTERYGKGEIEREEFLRKSDEISALLNKHHADRIESNRQLANLNRKAQRT